jgi:hypothetical protein
MNTVKILKNYTKSIVSDADAFEILCILYKDGPKLESELSEKSMIPSSALKGTLRDLYKSNFIRMSGGHSYSITPMAEVILSEFGVDGTIRSFLIHSITEKSSSSLVENYINYICNFKPYSERSITRTIRNLYGYISISEEIDDEKRNLLILDSMRKYTGYISNIIDNNEINRIDLFWDKNKKLFNNKEELWTIAEKCVGHGKIIDSLIMSKNYNSAQAELLDQYRCAIEFRVFDYLLTPDSDSMLELRLCEDGNNESTNLSAWDDVINSLSRKFSMFVVFSEDDNFSVALKKTADRKKHHHWTIDVNVAQSMRFSIESSTDRNSRWIISKKKKR